MTRSHRWLGLVTAGALVGLTACGSAAPAKTQAAPSATPSSTTPSSKTPSAAKPLRHVTLLLDWQIEGYQAPFFLGVAKGFYKDAGLDVKIIPGKGSLSTVQQMGHGNYDFGFADGATAAVAIAKGVPVKVVADYLQKDPNSVIFLTKAQIRKPAQLIGKSIGTSAGSASGALFPAFLKANHLTAGQVHLVDMSAHAKNAALESGKVDAIISWGFEVIPELARNHFKASQLNYGDWGVPALGAGIVVNDGYLTKHAATVKAFVQASDRAWTYARTHQAEAISAERAAARTPAGASTVLRLAYNLVHTSNSGSKPIGWMSPKDWAATIATLKKYRGLKSGKPVSAYYTDRFAQGA